ncbi:MAG TPA: DUF1345 domain-containing protein [Devosia sp.]|nr:DUF1345 domain-containing protein [Devosia sp.]
MAERKSRRAAPRHLGFYVAVAVGALAAIAAMIVAPTLALVVGANVFFAGYLVMTYWQLPHLTAEFLKKHAAEEDAPAPFILFVTVSAVVASVVSLIVAIATGEGTAGVAIGLGALSVILGWLAVHTMWAMHYAFEYYDRPDASGKTRGSEVVGGLDFPGNEEPDGTTFLYFSYVIGMTAQTSDTAVTSNAMRRIVTVHSIFSFLFNTVIVAAAVNIVVSLGR